MIFITDNESIVYVINRQTSKDPRLLSLLRTLVLICLKHILFRALNIERVRNILAHSLSRLQVESQTHRSAATRELGDSLMQLLEASLSSTSLGTYRRVLFSQSQLSI